MSNTYISISVCGSTVHWNQVPTTTTIHPTSKLLVTITINLSIQNSFNCKFYFFHLNFYFSYGCLNIHRCWMNLRVHYLSNNQRIPWIKNLFTFLGNLLLWSGWNWCLKALKCYAATEYTGLSDYSVLRIWQIAANTKFLILIIPKISPNWWKGWWAFPEF